MAASYTALYVHLVWGTAGREPWISETIEAPLLAAIADKCRKLRCAPLAIGTMPDHVHVLASLSPTVAVSRLVQEVKGASAHLVTHRLAPEIGFRWQGGYGAFTLRDEDTPVVRRYVLQQKSHHATAAIRSAWEQADILDA
jgi:REP element-mobilizing transposase RayT